jgi:hypothetical protein
VHQLHQRDTGKLIEIDLCDDLVVAVVRGDNLDGQVGRVAGDPPPLGLRRQAVPRKKARSGMRTVSGSRDKVNWVEGEIRPSPFFRTSVPRDTMR